MVFFTVEKKITEVQKSVTTKLHNCFFLGAKKSLNFYKIDDIFFVSL